MRDYAFYFVLYFAFQTRHTTTACAKSFIILLSQFLQKNANCDQVRQNEEQKYEKLKKKNKFTDNNIRVLKCRGKRKIQKIKIK